MSSSDIAVSRSRPARRSLRADALATLVMRPRSTISRDSPDLIVMRSVIARACRHVSS